MDYKKTIQYFYKKDYTVGATIIVVGLMISVIGMFFFPMLRGVALIFGVPLVITGGILLLFEAQKEEISDRQYDELVLKFMDKNFILTAYSKLGIDADEVNAAAPLFIDGYVFKGNVNIKKGKDEMWRSSKFRRIGIFFSENEVHVFTKTIKTTRNQAEEKTDVYFYDDIVSISTSTEKERKGNAVIEYESFILMTKAGTSLSVSIMNRDNAQRSINAMRSLLRMKKNN